MSRTLTTDALTKATTKVGTKPIILVHVDWTGPQWYASEALVLGTINVLGTLSSIGDLSSQLKDHQVGSLSTISIGLDDPIGTIKGILDTQNINGILVSVYQHFDGNAQSDLLLLFKGKLVDPSWTEGERQVSFSVESSLSNATVGFSVDDTTVSLDARKKMWPLVMGRQPKVPALRTEYRARAKLVASHNYTQTSFTVDDAAEFPSGTIKVIIEGIVFEGHFSANQFIIHEANVPKYQSLGFASRPVGDVDEFNHNVAWLGEFIPLANHRVMLQDTHGQKFFLTVTKQEDTKLYFGDGPNATGGTPLLFDTTRTILQVTERGRIGWLSPTPGYTRGPRDPLNWGQEHMSPSGSIILIPYGFQSGTEVVEWSETKPDVYVVNELEGTILAVHGMRQGLEEQIPTQYYTKHESYSYHGKTATVLKFKYPLEIFVEQGWSSDVWVTQESSQGTNTAEQIKWFLDTYSDIPTDSGSFSAVASGISGFPSSYALLEKRNVLDLVEDIAFQARCGIVYDQGTAILKYLSSEPGFTFNAGRSNSHYKSLVLKSTPLHDVVTKLTGTWQEDSLVKKKQEVIWSENESTYGLYERTIDFWIYNARVFVEKSVNFWGHRLANVWKIAVTKRFMAGAQLTLFDKINYQIAELGPDIKGVIQGLRYNIKERSFDVEVNTGAKVGSTVLDSTFWTTDTSIVDPDPASKYSETTEEYEWTGTRAQTDQTIRNQEIRTGIVFDVLVDGTGHSYAVFKDQGLTINQDGTRDVYL